MSRSSLFALLLALSSLFVAAPSQAQTYACFETNLGEEFCIKFRRDDAPNTVNNFVNYVNSAKFDKTLVHYSLFGVGIQGGNYYYDPTLGEEVPKDAPVANEFKGSNTRGTVAMYLTPEQPDSATTEWVINLADNSSTLDAQKYTVFADVVKGMSLVQAISNLGVVNLSESLGDAFDSVPVLRKDSDGVGIEDLVQITHVYTTDQVVEDPDGSQEAADLFQCTANWVAEVAPREVCMESNVGNFCMDLMPEVASKTVNNFLHYVADGDYNNTFIHRNSKEDSVFVLQGGGFKTLPPLVSVPADPAVENEYSTPNTRGTVALAKISGDPNSGTSEWFINTADNSEVLGPSNNGGFTVFAKVRDADMAVVDKIVALDRLNLSGLNGAFDAVPMINTSNPNGLSLADFVLVKRAYIPNHEVNPCVARPIALTDFAKRTFTVPVRMPNGDIFEFYFEQQYVPGEPVFRPVMWRVRALNDVGQDTAIFDGAVLTIPSVYVVEGKKLVTNVHLRLIEGTNDLDFRLESFDEAPDTTTP